MAASVMSIGYVPSRFSFGSLLDSSFLRAVSTLTLFDVSPEPTASPVYVGAQPKHWFGLFSGCEGST